MAEKYTLKIWSRPRPSKQHFTDLADALAALEERGREVEQTADGRAQGGTLIRRLDPVQIVIARLELVGPGRMRGGVDVRGDGSSEAYKGRVRRRLVEQRADESAYDALRRELS